MSDMGRCQKCGAWADLGTIAGTPWKVCLKCYRYWTELPEDHVAKAGYRREKARRSRM